MCSFSEGLHVKLGWKQNSHVLVSIFFTYNDNCLTTSKLATDFVYRKGFITRVHYIKG